MNEELLKNLGIQPTTSENEKSSNVEENKENKPTTSENEKSSNVEPANEVLSLFSMLGMEDPKKKEKKKENNAIKQAKTDQLDKDKVRIVKAYGQEVIRIEKGEVEKIEEIRKYLVETLGFREFQEKDTEMVIINDGNDTQYIIPQIKFKSKG